MDHFTAVCLVTWPLTENEDGVDLVLIAASPLFLCKFLLISMITPLLILEKQGGFYQNKVNQQPYFYSKARHLSAHLKKSQVMQL